MVPPISLASAPAPPPFIKKVSVVHKVQTIHAKKTENEETYYLVQWMGYGT
jgi:hypothetical protein